MKGLGESNDSFTFHSSSKHAMPPPIQSTVFSDLQQPVEQRDTHGNRKNVYGIAKKAPLGMVGKENALILGDKYAAERKRLECRHLLRDPLKEVQEPRAWTWYAQSASSKLNTAEKEVQTLPEAEVEAHTRQQQAWEHEAEAWIDLVCWENPFYSLYRFVQGAWVLAGLWYALYGAHQISMVAGIACLAAVNLFLNSLAASVSQTWQEERGWIRSRFDQTVSRRLAYMITQVALFHDAYLSAKDPTATLMASLTLWALCNFGKWCSVWAIAAISYVMMFTAPPLYLANKRAWHQFGSNIATAVKARYERLSSCVPRAYRAALMLATFLLLLRFMSWGNLGMALLSMAAAMRCMLKPAEVEALRCAATPLATSMQKTSRRLFEAANDRMERMTPARGTAGKGRRLHY